MRRSGPDRRTVVKDSLSFTLAWALVWFLAVYGVDGPMAWGLLALAGTLLGVPGMGEILNRVRTGTDGSGSDSPHSGSLPLSSSLSQDDLAP